MHATIKSDIHSYVKPVKQLLKPDDIFILPSSTQNQFEQGISDILISKANLYNQSEQFDIVVLFDHRE